MNDKSKLPPCPFCEGPPKPIVVRSGGGGIFSDAALACSGGLYVRAFVFCHECGAEGPALNEFAYDRAGCNALQAAAEKLWAERNSRNRGLYDAASAAGD